MSENIKPLELSSEELEAVAGGAVSAVDASTFDFNDAQIAATKIGGKGDGGIETFAAQETTVFEADLKEIKATGSLPNF